jgi:hypothetical protein
MFHVDRTKLGDAQVWSCKPQFQGVHGRVDASYGGSVKITLPISPYKIFKND